MAANDLLPRDRVEPPKLLRCIDEIVRLDDGAPGFSGLVSLVVQSGSDVRSVWNARFDASGVRTVFAPGIVDDADVVLVLDAEDADALIEEGDRIGERTIYGNRQLLDAMIRRYFITTSSLDIRLQAMTNRPKHERTRR